MNKIDHPEVVEIIDCNGFWVLVLSNGNKIDINYSVTTSDTIKGEGTCVVDDIPCKVNWVNPEFMAHSCECCTRDGGMVTDNNPDGRDNYVPYPEMKGEEP